MCGRGSRTRGTLCQPRGRGLRNWSSSKFGDLSASTALITFDWFQIAKLQDKVRKQKESHSQIQQKKASWKSHKINHSPDDHEDRDHHHPAHHHPAPPSSHSHHHQSQHNQSHHDVEEAQMNMDHGHHGEPGPDGEDDPNKSVFMRLHKTAIRNTRNHLNSSLHGDDVMLLHLDDHDGNAAAAGFLMNEPSRNSTQNEISKKPQRINPHANSSSILMLTEPVRVLSSDDDL